MTKQTSRKPSSKPAEASAGKAAVAGKKAARSEDLRLKVTGGVKQRFKQAAKAAGVKKGVLLERLLAEWEKRQPGPPVAPASPPKRPSRGA
jgi:hypothetical protein